MKGRSKGVKSKRFHRWTDEQIEYLFSIYKGKINKEIATMINDKFGTDIEASQVRTVKERFKLNSGIDGKFKKGEIPFNKGTKGVMKANKGSFKKGNIPPQHREVGSERVNVDGMIEIKVAEPSKWEHKQRHIYKQHHGEIEKGNVIMFLDGNNRNFDISNLASISRKEMLILNNRGLISSNGEVTKVGINIAKVIDKIREKSK